LKKFKSHIAFILAGIFLFPMLVQSTHFLAHAQQHHCSGFECSNISLNSEALAFNPFIDAGSDDNCLICDYKISLKNIPQAFNFGFDIDVHFMIRNLIAEAPHIGFESHPGTPRAPPAKV
jgi:hypothetical protein